MDLAKLEANAFAIAQMLGVLAHQQRIRILCRLVASNKEMSIAALSAGTDISQSALSQHLAKLRKGGIISVRRAGHNSFFRLADPRAVQLVNALPQVLKTMRGNASAGDPQILTRCMTSSGAS